MEPSVSIRPATAFDGSSCNFCSNPSSRLSSLAGPDRSLGLRICGKCLHQLREVSGPSIEMRHKLLSNLGKLKGIHQSIGKVGDRLRRCKPGTKSFQANSEALDKLMRESDEVSESLSSFIVLDTW